MKKGCYHRSIYGRMSVKNQEVGLCLDCSQIIDINTGRVVIKNVAYAWMQRHPKEVEVYKLI